MAICIRRKQTKLELESPNHDNTNAILDTSHRQMVQMVTLIKSILITTEDCVHLMLISDKKSSFDVVKAKIFGNLGIWDPQFTRHLQLEFVSL